MITYKSKKEFILVAKSSLFGAITAGITASLCCIAPLVLVTLGISGAWISTLVELDFLQPYAIIATILFLSVAFWKLYIQSAKPGSNAVCENYTIMRWQKMIFWVVSILLTALLTFPLYITWFY